MVRHYSRNIFFRLLFPVLPLFIAILLPGQPQVALQPVADGFDQPLGLVNAGDDRLFVVEKKGRIRIIGSDGQVLPSPFLDITDRVGSGGNEQGLLGLAFHPDYPENGYFYVNYTNLNGDTHISRFEAAGADVNSADPGSEKILFTVDQPRTNHNGGDLQFGPDGYLYIGLGDGGGGGDPDRNAQNLRSLLGKLLRIDVDGGDPYGIPSGNPFAGGEQGLPEIWAYGLRNPWRFSFDRENGDLWIGDVGQNSFEEVDFVEAGRSAGANFGWPCYEAYEPFRNTDDCPAADRLTFPVIAHPHPEQGCRSITGGYVYRGLEFPNLRGTYFYADYCTGELFSLLPALPGDFVGNTVLQFGRRDLAAFGEDQNGELYVVSIGPGTVYRLVDLCASLRAPAIRFENDVLSVPDTFATYQWLLNDEPIPGATSAEYVPADEGAFRVQVFDDQRCQATSDAFIITSIAEAIGIRWWQVTPNPFRDVIRLEVEVTEPAAFQMKLYDAGGRLLRRDRLERARRWSRQYDLSELKSGLYFFTLERGSQRVVTKILKTY